MVFKRKVSEDSVSSVSGIVRKILRFLSATPALFSGAQLFLQGRFLRLLRQAQYQFVLYIWVSAGVFLFLMGIFDLLIDLVGIPRGVVFSIGGLFVFLTAILLLQAAREGKFKK